MADLSEITAYFASTIAAALYPHAASPVFTESAKVYEGWPNSTALDADMIAGVVHVTVFPMPGSTGRAAQILDESHVIAPAVHGLSASIAGQAVTFAGAPGAGEYATLICDGKHIYSRSGTTLAAILAALAADAGADYAGVTTTSNSITVPASLIVARIGAPATMGRVTWRQRHQIMITIWANTPTARSGFAGFIDGLIKQNNVITLPDTSQALVTYDRTNTDDKRENALVYRRDLVFTVEYATVEQFQAYEVTSVTADPSPTMPDGYQFAPTIA